MPTTTHHTPGAARPRHPRPGRPRRHRDRRHRPRPRSRSSRWTAATPPAQRSRAPARSCAHRRRAPARDRGPEAPAALRLERARGARPDPVPARLGVVAKTASADLELRGRAGAFSTKTASGDVIVEAAGGDVDVKTASGDVAIGAVAGRANVNTMSGDIVLDEASGSVSVHTMSGDLRVERLASGTAEMRTMSGDIVASVAPRRHALDRRQLHVGRGVVRPPGVRHGAVGRRHRHRAPRELDERRHRPAPRRGGEHGRCLIRLRSGGTATSSFSGSARRPRRSAPGVGGRLSAPGAVAHRVARRRGDRRVRGDDPVPADPAPGGRPGRPRRPPPRDDRLRHRPAHGARRACGRGRRRPCAARAHRRGRARRGLPHRRLQPRRALGRSSCSSRPSSSSRRCPRTRPASAAPGSLGQPLGGALFGLGRAVPFAFDAASYVVSLVTWPPFGARCSPPTQRSAGTLGRDGGGPALALAAAVHARDHVARGRLERAVPGRDAGRHRRRARRTAHRRPSSGSSSRAGASAAWPARRPRRVARRACRRGVVIGANWVWAGLLPVIALVREPIAIGAAGRRHGVRRAGLERRPRESRDAAHAARDAGAGAGRPDDRRVRSDPARVAGGRAPPRPARPG